MTMRLTRDETFKVVLNIRTPRSNGLAEVGTGMFVVKDNTKPYILTATHVAKATNSKTEVIISSKSGDCESIPLGRLCGTQRWIHHPSADISALSLVVDPVIYPLLEGRFFPYEQLNTSRTMPSRDAYLTSVGFPNGLGAQGKFSPFTFRSHASSSEITLLRADTQTPCNFFALENPSVGGYSGGPIFDLGYIIVGAITTTTGPTVCHGIMHGTLSDSTGGKIAAVTPCYYASDIL